MHCEYYYEYEQNLESSQQLRSMELKTFYTNKWQEHYKQWMVWQDCLIHQMLNSLMPPCLIIWFAVPEKNPYSHHRRYWNFLGSWGSVRPKGLKECIELHWNFQRGAVLEEIPSMGKVWMFSGTTQCVDFEQLKMIFFKDQLEKHSCRYQLWPKYYKMDIHSL